MKSRPKCEKGIQPKYFLKIFLRTTQELIKLICHKKMTSFRHYAKFPSIQPTLLEKVNKPEKP